MTSEKILEVMRKVLEEATSRVGADKEWAERTVANWNKL